MQLCNTNPSTSYNKYVTLEVAIITLLKLQRKENETQPFESSVQKYLVFNIKEMGKLNIRVVVKLPKC